MKLVNASRYSFSSVSALAICAVCFLAGRYTQQGADVPATATLEPAPSPQVVSRKLSARARVQAEDPAPSPNIDFDFSPENIGPGAFEAAFAATQVPKLRPPLAPGDGGSINYTVQPFQVLSWYPRAWLFPGFLNKSSCEHVIHIGETMLHPSGLALRQGESAESSKNIRTSQGAFLTRGMDPDGVLAYIEDRIALLTHLPVSHGEAFNILRYEHNQKYDSHFDSFDPKEYGKMFSQRIATVLFYLTDVEEGGETIFKWEGKDADVNGYIDYAKCDKGMKYLPRAGDALLFFSVNPDNELDKHALHGGCPVKKGIKWVMTKWIRDRG